MIVLLKKRIVFLSFLIAVLFSFINLNVSFVYATQKSGDAAEQELKERLNKTTTNDSGDKKNEHERVRNDSNNVTSSDDNVNGTKHDSTKDIQFLTPGKFHPQLHDKQNVITHDGGGIGVGGGAKKSSGGKSGKSIDISDTGTSNQEVINNSASDNDGKDLISETMGFAKDDGKFYRENEGEYAGPKIFEFDRNGGLGFDEDHIGVSNIKGFMSFFLFAAFGLGGLSFFMATRDIRSKNNYF